jgi:hypothetical protein
MAEAFAIKGFCYERLPVQTGNRGKLQEREHKITRCFELSADLTLLYLQVRTVEAIEGHFVMGSCVYTFRMFTRNLFTLYSVHRRFKRLINRLKKNDENNVVRVFHLLTSNIS